MNTLIKMLTTGAVMISFQTAPQPADKPITQTTSSAQPKIQAAILLDVSNSMDGLIDQAKAQLWNMVNVMGKVKCNQVVPQVEIALYEYGRPANDPKNGYVKQISAFTTNLDQLSQNLFSLKTNGGDEYCGHVIYNSVKELQWDTSSSNYKVIFIAGNEDFLQGDIAFTKACKEAKEKGIIVNTIYCGDKMNGIQEHWNLGVECGNGSYTNINKDAKLEEIETPYDSTMITLNEQLNATYISYGFASAYQHDTQKNVDKANFEFSKSASIKRIAAKGKKNLYKNTTWDLVDAMDADSTLIDKVELKTLHDSLQKKSRPEIKKIVKTKSIQRNDIQKKIADLDVKRASYIILEKTKTKDNTNIPTLESEIEKIIRQQVARFNMQVE